MTYQGNDDLTVRVSLEVVLGLQVLAQDTVVVDFAVNGEGEGGVIVDKGLSTGVWGRTVSKTKHCRSDSSMLLTNTDDTQTLVGQNCRHATVSPVPRDDHRSCSTHLCSRQ